MRRNLLLVAVLLLSAIAYADDWKKEYSVGNNPELKVGTNDAGIEVRRGGSKIEAFVRTEGYKIGPGDVHIYERQDGDRVSIDVSTPRHNFVFGWGNRNVHITVVVPANTKLDLRSGDGSIHVSGIQAPADVSSGDGRIDVTDFAGPLRAHTNDGSMRVEGRFDDLDLSSGDGSIQCQIRPGSKMKNSWKVRTNDGSIHLQIPDDLIADLYAHTNDGHINVNGAGASTLASHSSDDDRREIRAKLNGGGMYKLSAETGDGSITISR
jgi:hypothetical protein